MEQGFLSIKKWADEDRPREKLLLKGKASLSDAELIAILISTGTSTMTAVDLAKLILAQAENDLNKLAQFSVKDLQKIKGIGEAKAITIVSALELGRRRRELDPVKKLKMTTSNEIYQYIKADLLDLDHEQFWVILLDRACQVIKKVRISAGGVTGTVVDEKIVYKLALEYLAQSIVLVHNHPSGNLKPSDADRSLTKKLKLAGELFSINVIDHIIFTNNGYYSFSDEGIL